MIQTYVFIFCTTLFSSLIENGMINSKSDIDRFIEPKFFYQKFYYSQNLCIIGLKKVNYLISIVIFL